MTTSLAIGSVVRDAEGRMWIRLSTREQGWWMLDEFGDAGVVGPPVRWDQLEPPITRVEWWSPPEPETDTSERSRSPCRASTAYVP